jgi:hypothetical protein
MKVIGGFELGGHEKIPLAPFAKGGTSFKDMS